MTVPRTPEVPEPTGHDVATEPTTDPQHPGNPAQDMTQDMTGGGIADLDARTSHLNHLGGPTAPAKQRPARGSHADGTGPAGASGFVREAHPDDLTAIGAVHAASMLASLEAGHRSAHGTDLPEGVRAMVAPPVVATGWQEAVASPPSPEHHVLVATQEGVVVGLLGLAPTRSVDTQPLDPGSPGNSRPDSTVADSTGTVGTGRTGPESAVPTAAGTKPPAFTDANRSQVSLLSLPPPQDSGLTEDQESLPAAEVTALGVDPAYQRRGHGSRLLAAAADTARDEGAAALVVWAVRGDDSLARFLRSAGLAPTGAHRELPVGQGVTEDCWVAQL